MDNYQNIILDGKEYGKRRRKNSKFFNEGKWDNFISPLLPKDCSGLTFIEFGCNYGLFLKLAKQRGFENVLGVESNPLACGIAEKYVGSDAVIIRRTLRNNIFRRQGWFNDLPAADYVLLSNFHYHVHLSVLLHFIHLLRRKARYVIVVSTEDGLSRLYMAKCHSDYIRKYFREWKEIGHIDPFPANGDPSPRKMFSILFKSEVERVPIKKIIGAFGPYGMNFYKKIKRDAIANKWHYPMNYPLLLTLPHRNLNDGHHRLASLELDGKASALVEVI